MLDVNNGINEHFAVGPDVYSEEFLKDAEENYKQQLSVEDRIEAALGHSNFWKWYCAYNGFKCC